MIFFRFLRGRGAACGVTLSLGASVGLCGCAMLRMEPPVFKPDHVRRAELAAANAEALALRGAVKPDHEVATLVMDLPGYVRTPFTHPRKLVDVRGLRPGCLVVCPFTGRLFNLPLDFVDAGPHAGLQPAPRQRFERVGSGRSTAAEVAPARTPVASAAAGGKSPALLPYGRAVPGRPGFVYSPFASSHQMVDVSGLAAGMEVKCPYSGKIFRVPVGE